MDLGIDDAMRLLTNDNLKLSLLTELFKTNHPDYVSKTLVFFQSFKK